MTHASMATPPSITMASVKEVFHIDSTWQVPVLPEPTEYTPPLDPDYYFEKETTLAILAGFIHNRRVLIQGYHGTGKSTHIEQVAARLNWPCIRVNLDSYISRIDLVGRDAIVVKDGLQVTEFREGIIPWALQQPMALVLDEYDAGRPEVMFVLQRLLEQQGYFTLLEKNQVMKSHPFFRMFATANTIGLGDATGLYQGTHLLNQGQLDRWNILATLNYLDSQHEQTIILAKVPAFKTTEGEHTVKQMVVLANLIRKSFMSGDLSTVMSPRTLISWAENMLIFNDRELAFRFSFLNKCDEAERIIIAEFYQRCFNVDLPESAIHLR